MDAVITKYACQLINLTEMHNQYSQGTEFEKKEVLRCATESLLRDFINQVEEVGKYTEKRFISQVRASQHTQLHPQEQEQPPAQ